MDEMVRQGKTTIAEIWHNTTPFSEFPSNRMNMNIDINNTANVPGGSFTFTKRPHSLSPASTNATNENDAKRMKRVAGNENERGEGSSGKVAEETAKPAEPQKQDYIHVRARRGQATDSHSLAERARREKISERMKVLQDLVPGCNKVIGKALVLDEIINYVQSLQHQVEFLSMKLEAVNSRAAPNIEGFPLKDFGQQAFDTSGLAFSTQTTNDFRGTSPEWLHMQLGGGFERTT